MFILFNQQLTNIYFIYKSIHSISLAANQYIPKIRQTLPQEKQFNHFFFILFLFHLGVHIFSKFVFSYIPNTDHVYMAFSYNMYVQNMILKIPHSTNVIRIPNNVFSAVLKMRINLSHRHFYYKKEVLFVIKRFKMFCFK